MPSDRGRPGRPGRGLRTGPRGDARVPAAPAHARGGPGFLRNLVATTEVWVAEEGERVAGFVSLDGDLLGHIFAHPHGLGAGSALLEKAKERRPGGFHLWVFQRNEGARRFYERHGLRLAELTDGAGNEQRLPDARYEWRP